MKNYELKKHEKSFFIEKGRQAENTKTCLGEKLVAQSSSCIDGTWAEWEFDGIEFKFVNDRLGFYPVYYYSYNGKFGISTSIVELIEKGSVPLTLDNEAIAVFIRLGFFLGEDTPFQYIRSVPPGCCIKWKDGAFDISTKGYVSSRLALGISRDSAIEEYGVIFQNTINGLLGSYDSNEKVGVPLSGGRDSRHIALALFEGKANIHAFLTIDKDDDFVVSRRVAAELGIPQKVIYQSESRFNLEIIKNYLTSFCSDEHAWVLVLADYIREHKYSVIYDGVAGGILSAGAFLNKRKLTLFQEGKVNELADLLLLSEDYTKFYLPENLYKAFNRELASNRLVSELNKHLDTPNPVAQFYLWNRTRREIALTPWGLYGHDIKVMAPFLGRDVYDFLTGLPGEYFLDHNFHDEAIKKCYFKFSHLPFEQKTSNPIKNYKKLISTFKEIGLTRSYIKYTSNSDVEGFDNSSARQLIDLARMYLRSKNGHQFLRSLRIIIYLIQLDLFSRKNNLRLTQV